MPFVAGWSRVAFIKTIEIRMWSPGGWHWVWVTVVVIVIINSNTITNITSNNCMNHCRLCPCWPRSSSLWRRSSSSSSWTPETAPACVSHCKLVSLLATSQGHEQRTRKTSPGCAAHPAKVSAGQTAPRPNSYFKLSVHPGYLGWEPVSSKLLTLTMQTLG